MKVIRVIIAFLFIFTFVLVGGERVVFGGYSGGGISESTITTPANGWYPGPGGKYYYSSAACPAGGCQYSPAGSYTNQSYAGYYYSPNTGLFYPIGAPPSIGGGGGSGPSGVDTCTGVYDNCSAWTTCSPSCGPGTQARACYDTGCGSMQEQSQACMTNDPNVWLPPTTLCSMKCGTGTWDLVNQCGTTQAFACNTQTCADWIKLKNSSFISPNSLSNMINLAPTAYDADDTTEQYLIVGKSGVAVAPGIDIEVSNFTTTSRTGNPEYTALYTPSAFLMTPSYFISYIKACKEYKGRLLPAGRIKSFC